MRLCLRTDEDTLAQALGQCGGFDSCDRVGGCGAVAMRGCCGWGMREYAFAVVAGAGWMRFVRVVVHASAVIDAGAVVGRWDVGGGGSGDRGGCGGGRGLR